MAATTAVHQLVSTLSWGDGVGNIVRQWQRLLRSWGFASEIFALRTDAESRPLAKDAATYPDVADERTALLIHHSFQLNLLSMLRRAPGRIAVVYQNVTPAHFFRGLDSKLAGACEAAREELYALAEIADRGYAPTRFSAEELTAAGFRNVSVLPLTMDWAAFEAAPDETLLASLRDGCRNVLFVGRAVPNKRIEDVLRVFTAYQRLYQPRSRLIIAGELNVYSPYVTWLQAVRDALKPDRVQILGRVTQAQLAACYRAADVYLSMSQHEGFGLPLIEAMHRGVPVVAYGAAAVPETMGGAGVVSLTRDPFEVAKLLAVLDRNEGVRARVIERQRERASDFSVERSGSALRQSLEPLLSGEGRRPPAASSAREVLLVCPSFEAAPDGPPARAARALASALAAKGRVRVLALKAKDRPAGPGPEVSALGAAQVEAFSPELPIEPEQPLPGSSALETAVRVSRGPVVFFGEGEVSRALLPHLGERAYTVAPDGWESSVRRLAEELR